MSRNIVMAWTAVLTAGLLAIDLPAQEPRPDGPIDFDGVIVNARAGGMRRTPSGPFQDFNEVTKGAQQVEGLFTLHRKGDHLYAEIRPDQFDQPLLVPMTIARGMGQAGVPVGGEEMVLIFRHVGDRVQLVRRNIHYKAPAGTPLDKSVKQNYTDSVLMALPIIALNQMRGGAVLIDFSDIFMTDFAQLRLGVLDRSRTSWAKVKGFPNNMELQLEATFSPSGAGRPRVFLGNDGGVADQRGITLVIHYSLVRAPEGGYHPRTADDRVGYFLSASKDFGTTDIDSNFERHINRWRLEKANPQSKLSPPKKQIVWYIEDTVPFEYRPHVEEGIREWNKAFEKVGFRDAIAVRWEEPGRDEFDPEDTNYCTFRWITSDRSYAMSCLRANPLTGEMIDGDVVFDASLIRMWKQQYALLVGSSAAVDGQDHVIPLAIGEVISPILASKSGYGQPLSHNLLGIDAIEKNPGAMVPELIPADENLLSWQLAKNLAQGNRGFCQFQSGIQRDLGLAVLALQTKPEPQTELPEEFIGQAIKSIVMHEVGHSLGLRHNFKASTMLTARELNDTAVTHAKGLSGSVMDYLPINIAPKGKKQGDYFTITIGPYDYWAIEYAYKPIDGDEAAELKKIATRAPEHDLVYATDEDSFLNDDPYVNRWDLGADPCQFGKDRITLAAELLKNLDARVVKAGESWARVRRAFSILLAQYGDGATLAAQFVAGQSVSRDHKADKDARDPIVPVLGARQRECLSFLAETILSDKAFQFSPALLRRLGADRWRHWGSGSAYEPGIDISVLERVLGIQKIVLAHCLSAQTLARLENQQLQANPGSNPLRMEEVFRALTEGIWSDLNHPTTANGSTDSKFVLSTIRRNLQREYLSRLASIVLGSSPNPYGDAFSYVVFLRGANPRVPADARALARLHLKEISSRIGWVLESNGQVTDDTSRAHLEECRHRIAKVLDANLDVREP